MKKLLISILSVSVVQAEDLPAVPTASSAEQLQAQRDAAAGITTPRPNVIQATAASTSVAKTPTPEETLAADWSLLMKDLDAFNGTLQEINTQKRLTNENIQAYKTELEKNAGQISTLTEKMNEITKKMTPEQARNITGLSTEELEGTQTAYKKIGETLTILNNVHSQAIESLNNYEALKKQLEGLQTQFKENNNIFERFWDKVKTWLGAKNTQSARINQVDADKNAAQQQFNDNITTLANAKNNRVDGRKPVETITTNNISDNLANHGIDALKQPTIDNTQPTDIGRTTAIKPGFDISIR